MLEFLKSLSSSWFGADDRRRQETEAEDAARLIEMDEPMAGAGGQVSGMHSKSETEKALERKAVRPLEVSLELPDGARIASGKEREEAGQLGGRVERRSVTWWNVDHSTSERTKVEWVVEASAGERIGVVASHERAGTVRAELVL